METHTKIFVRMKNYRRCSYSFFTIGYFCSHVGVGVSDTLADRSGQQYFCIVIVIGYSRSCDTINIGKFGSYGVRAFVTSAGWFSFCAPSMRSTSVTSSTSTKHLKSSLRQQMCWLDFRLQMFGFLTADSCDENALWQVRTRRDFNHRLVNSQFDW